LIEKTDCLFALFDSEASFSMAVNQTTAKGYSIKDLLMPYPVKAIGNSIKANNDSLYISSFIGGIIGLTGIILLIFYVHTKPSLTFGNKWHLPLFNSIPVIFSVIILFAGLSGIVYFLIKSHLIPGNLPHIYEPYTTDNQFLIIFDLTDNILECTQWLSDQGAIKIYTAPYYSQNYPFPFPIKVKL
jgi:hypothetical protein